VVGDTTFESNETVVLTMGNPIVGGTTLAANSGTVVSNLTTLPSGNGARSYNAWIKLEPGDSGTLIGHGTINPSTFYHRSAFIVEPSKLTLDFQVGSVQGTNLSLADGAWHMVTAVFDAASTANGNTGISFYVDGSAVSTVTAGANGFNKTSVNTINYQNSATFDSERAVVNGATTNGLNHSILLSGSQIDDAGIWNRALTAAEINALYANPSSAPAAGLVTMQYLADGYHGGVATLGTNTTYTHTIVNDDVATPTVSFTTTTASINEGNSDYQAFYVSANLSSVATTDSSIPFTVSGTATAGTDYTIFSSNIVIPVGSTSGSIPFYVLGDTTIESNETVVFTMGTPTGAALGTNTTYTHTITNDDVAPPTISFTSTTTSANEGNSGNQTVTVNASLSTAATTAVTVPITVSGTATANTDYTNAPTSITIPMGSTSWSASFNVVGDTTVESNETVVLTMGTPTGAALGTNTTYTHTITNDDVALPTVSFTTSAASSNEGNSDYQAFYVSANLSSVATTDSSILFTVSGTATAGTDYTIF
jgi:hypothetical protein